jgi:hypothetical protein
MPTSDIPYTRIATWLVGCSTIAGTAICELLNQENIASVEDLGPELLYISAELASFHTSTVIQLIMEARQFAGRKDFTLIYNELEKAIIADVMSAHSITRSRIGYLACAISDYRHRDVHFNIVQQYFEGNEAELGITPKEMDHYATVFEGKGDIRTLDSPCRDVLIRITRIIDRILIKKGAPFETAVLSMTIICGCALQNKEYGFLGVYEAVRNLLASKAGDKQPSELNAEKLILQDMAAFLKT